MFGWFRGKAHSALGDVARELSALRELVETSQRLLQAGDNGQSSDPDWVRRMESLEGRFEELRSQCLRHLQSASQRLKLAETKEQELEEAGEALAPLPEQMDLPGVTSGGGEEEDDLSWARRKIAERGEVPLGG